MVNHIIRQYNFNLAFARKLVEDLDDEQMTTVPGNGLENHPAFTLGHLVSGSAMMVVDLGGNGEMPAEWIGLFLRRGPGDPAKPNPDSSLYPKKEELLAELEYQHNKVTELLLAASAEDLQKIVPWRFAAYMPTLLDVALFMCINHEAMHLGQLSAWRRAMGLPSALGSLK